MKPASVLIIGSGPIVIGQAAEFDYAGTQACKAMREARLLRMKPRVPYGNNRVEPSNSGRYSFTEPLIPRAAQRIES